MANKVLITAIIGLPIIIGVSLYLKRPKAKIVTNKDGSGIVTLGNKSATYAKGMGVNVSTWNGWELSVSSTGYLLRHYGKLYHQGNISEGGNSNVEIIHN